LILLRSDQARVATQETKDLIEQLTDIGLKVSPFHSISLSLYSRFCRQSAEKEGDVSISLADLFLSFCFFQLKLLDLSGEMISIPTTLIAPPPPSNVDFFFA